ncbi:hypothetical protein evm_001251 [Chilo suppressalis]|nr:hypothetical protein evm_001251 [Chilo suppressalis]
MDELIHVFVNDIINEATAAAVPRRRRCESREDPFEMRDADFIKNFRLNKNLVRNLMNMVEPFIEQKEIDLKTKVLCALNFFATGSYQTPVGNSYIINLSQPSVSRCIKDIINALNNEVIFKQWVHFPRTHQELNAVLREFYDIYQFPGVVGCIDCTHVAIVPPPTRGYLSCDERAYVNRKNYHSINVQLICDAKLKILNVNALFPGSTHDSYIWNNSQVLTLMEQLHRTGHQNYHLIGDSGYALRPWMLTPLSNPPEGTAEHRYNEALKTTRATVERLNGVLKARFRCLLKDRVLHYKPSTATKIINACTVLHNMCMANNLDLPEVDEGDDIMDLNIKQLHA